MSQHKRTNIPPKPKRPLTVFNLFYKLERNFIMQQNQARVSVPSQASTDDRGVDPYLSMRPERYRGIVLPFDWYVVGKNKVKRHKHKNHGVISFTDLTKTMSERWKVVDDETRLYCNMIAKAELKKYEEDMAAFKKMYGEDAIKAQKRTYKKRRKSSNEAPAPQVASVQQNVPMAMASIALLSNPPNHPMLQEFPEMYLSLFGNRGSNGIW